MGEAMSVPVAVAVLRNFLIEEKRDEFRLDFSNALQQCPDFDIEDVFKKAATVLGIEIVVQVEGTRARILKMI